MRRRDSIPAVRAVLGSEVATFGSTDGTAQAVERTPLVEGRFPDTGRIVPDGESLAEMKVDAKRLAEVLTTFVALHDGDAGYADVTLELRGKDKSVVLRMKRTDGVQAVALVVPLT